MSIIKIILIFINIIKIFPLKYAKSLCLNIYNKSIDVRINYSKQKDLLIYFYGKDIIDIYDTEHNILIKNKVNINEISLTDNINKNNFIRYIKASVRM